MGPEGRVVEGLLVPHQVSNSIENAGGFRKMLSRCPSPKEFAARASFHAALSDKVRLRILWALSESDLCPCLLKRVTRMSDSKLSYHLGILQKAGIIKVRRTKSWRIYSITPSGMRCLG